MGDGGKDGTVILTDIGWETGSTLGVVGADEDRATDGRTGDGYGNVEIRTEGGC